MCLNLISKDFWDEIQTHLTWYNRHIKDCNVEIEHRLALDVKVNIEFEHGHLVNVGPNYVSNLRPMFTMLSKIDMFQVMVQGLNYLI